MTLTSKTTRWWYVVVMALLLSFPLHALGDDVTSAQSPEITESEELAPAPERVDVPEAEETATTPQNTLVEEVKSPDNALKDSQSDPDQLGELPNFGESLIRMVVVLTIMIVLMLVLGKLLPRWLSKTGKPTGKNMQVVDQIQLEPGKKLFLVRVGGQYLLVGSDAEGMRTLADDSLDQSVLGAAFQDASAAAVDGSSTRTFGSVLSRAEPVGVDPADINKQESA